MAEPAKKLPPNSQGNQIRIIRQRPNRGQADNIINFEQAKLRREKQQKRELINAQRTQQPAETEPSEQQRIPTWVQRQNTEQPSNDEKINDDNPTLTKEINQPSEEDIAQGHKAGAEQEGGQEGTTIAGGSNKNDSPNQEPEKKSNQNQAKPEAAPNENTGNEGEKNSDKKENDQENDKISDKQTSPKNEQKNQAEKQTPNQEKKSESEQENKRALTKSQKPEREKAKREKDKKTNDKGNPAEKLNKIIEGASQKGTGSILKAAWKYLIGTIIYFGGTYWYLPIHFINRYFTPWGNFFCKFGEEFLPKAKGPANAQMKKAEETAKKAAEIVEILACLGIGIILFLLFFALFAIIGFIAIVLANPVSSLGKIFWNMPAASWQAIKFVGGKAIGV